MKYNLQNTKVFVLFFFTLSYLINITAQTPASKPAPYHSVKDYQDAHPQSKYTPTQTKTVSSPTYTPSYNKSTTSTVNDLFSKSIMISEPVTADENDSSIAIAKELIKLIQSASRDYEGYKGAVKSVQYESYRVINTDFFKSQSQEISIHTKTNSFLLNIYDPKMIKKIYLAVLKQIPLLTNSTIKYNSRETFKFRNEVYSYYGLFSDIGYEIASLEIKNDLTFMHFEINSAK